MYGICLETVANSFGPCEYRFWSFFTLVKLNHFLVLTSLFLLAGAFCVFVI